MRRRCDVGRSRRSTSGRERRNTRCHIRTTVRSHVPDNPVCPASSRSAAEPGPAAVVLVLHGGRAHSRESGERKRLTYRRMLPFARTLARRGPGCLHAALPRTAAGTPRPSDALRDARWAHRRDRRAPPGACRWCWSGTRWAAGPRSARPAAPNVVAVCALAPWLDGSRPGGPARRPHRAHRPRRPGALHRPGRVLRLRRCAPRRPGSRSAGSTCPAPATSCSARRRLAPAGAAVRARRARDRTRRPGDCERPGAARTARPHALQLRGDGVRPMTRPNGRRGRAPVSPV